MAWRTAPMVSPVELAVLLARAVLPAFAVPAAARTALAGHLR
jgi:hypothetical protein